MKLKKHQGSGSLVVSQNLRTMTADLRFPALDLSALIRPFQEPLHLQPILPAQPEEFTGGHTGSFGPQESVESPS
jgi:hypothetical protein